MTKEQFKTITPEVGELDFIIDEDYSLNKSARNVGEIIPSVIPLTDAGLHLLDGALIRGDGIYGGFVDYIADLYGDGTAVPDYFCTETEWQTAVTTYGVCGKFVYDSTNNTVRLPKYGTQIYTKPSTLNSESSAPVKGNGKSLGFTDGSTNYGLTVTENTENSWAYRTSCYNSNVATSGGGNNGEHPPTNAILGITKDSSKSGIVADISNLKDYPCDCYYYIVLATSIKSDVEIDLEKVLEEIDNLTGKNMFDIVPKDHILSYSETKGFAQLGSYVYKEAVAGSRYGYPDFYAKVLAEYQDPNNTTETVSGVTITVNANGHKFYDIADKADIDSLFTTRGEAWFYGIDTTNERIFLPRSTRIKFGDSSNVGEYQEAGLPSIQHKHYNGVVDDGANIWTTTNQWGKEGCSNGGSNSTTGYTSGVVDVENSIYGNSTTVEYSSTKLIPYMVVGNTNVEGAIGEYIDVTTTENDTLPLFYGAYFDYTPNNVSWVLAGGQVASGTIYEFAYNELVNELSTPKYGLQVIEEDDMVVGVDYSTYWKVNQDQQYFIAPTKLSYGALTGGVYGDGQSVMLYAQDRNNNVGARAWLSNYGSDYIQCAPIVSNIGVQYTPNTFISDSNVHFVYDQTTIGIATKEQLGNLSSGLIAEQSTTAKLYFKVANAVQNLELLDAGEVLEAVNGIATTVANTPHITETYVNGTSWYRVYSDGWCEQGGIATLSNYSSVTLLKSYIDTNYSLILTSNGPTYNEYAYVSGYDKTVSGFNVAVVEGNSGKNNVSICWQACGYIR